VPDWLEIVLLGVIEGITEWLPVSSTGHLLLAQAWLQPRSGLFNVVVQCGAVLAVVLAFFERLRQMSRTWRDPATQSYLLKLATAFGLTSIGGLALKQLGFKLPENPAPVAWATLIGGILILLAEAWLRRHPRESQITWPVAAAVGVGQVLAAVFPGTSRSGATILMALAMGVGRPAAAEFSFLLGIPTLFAAGGLEIASALRQGETVEWGSLLLGSVVATLTAFAAVRWLLRYVQTHTFVAFGWYRIALGLAILCWFR
jgi:undecaprenyl-diphosphatase